MTKKDLILSIKDEIATCRRAMHENPQTCFEEEFASNLVAEKLAEWGIPFERGLAKTGLVGTIEGRKTVSGKSIGLRADLDALNIDEAHNKPWVSKIPGKMHGCGHDGHTAMLLGAAKYLSETRNFDGTVHLIFQPAEEGGQGARAMIEEGLFEKFPCDSVYGLHNRPYLPRGTFGICTGPIMAGINVVKITVHGKDGHSSAPHRAVDPIMVGAHIVTALQTFVSRNVGPINAVTLTITDFHAGTDTHNVIPGKAELIGSFRAFDHEVRRMLEVRIGEVAAGIAESMGATVDYDCQNIIEPTVNDKNATAFCIDVARKVAGEHNVDPDLDPSMGGEDFGAMLMGRPGAYIIMGQGEPENPDSNHSQSLHSACYDFNDEALPIGIEYWVTLAEEALPIQKDGPEDESVT